jgi:acetyltransferase (GNAT) family protein
VPDAAEDADDILGFAFSWVCGNLWFLAELFVSPSHQGRGIGNVLLKGTLGQAQTRGATNKALITFTFNTISQGLYIRHGMFPRLPIYNFNVGRALLLDRLKDEKFRPAPLEDRASHLRSVAHIDEQALGMSRERHHRHLINDSGIKGFIFHADDDCLGYALHFP